MLQFPREGSAEAIWRPDPSDPLRERIWLGNSWGSRSGLGTVAGMLGAAAVVVGLGGVIAGIILISSVGVGIGVAVLAGAWKSE